MQNAAKKPISNFVQSWLAAMLMYLKSVAERQHDLTAGDWRSIQSDLYIKSDRIYRQECDNANE